MEFEDLDILTNPSFTTDSSNLYYETSYKIILAKKIADTFFVSADYKVVNQVVKLIKEFEEKYVNYFLINPAGFYTVTDEDDLNHSANIHSYLRAYCMFYYRFKDINYNIIDNLLKYCDRFNCFDLIHKEHKEYQKEVNKTEYWYGKKSYKTKAEVRMSYNKLMRSIKILKIVGS